VLVPPSSRKSTKPSGEDNPELEDVIRHELAHIVLHLHLGKDYLDVPAWGHHVFEVAPRA